MPALRRHRVTLTNASAMPRLPPLADVNVDVEVDPADAGLLGPVRSALVPATLAGTGIPDIGEPQASPLWKRTAALPRELPCQHDFLAALADADDMRT